MSNPKMFRYDLIWKKNTGSDFLNANRKPVRNHENILVFYRKPPIYNPQKTKGKPYSAKNGDGGNQNYCRYKGGHHTANVTGDRYPNTVIEFQKPSNANKQHPTQKPVGLLEWLIKTYTNEGGVVLDNCMGVGSACIAAINTNRHYIGYELEQKYFEIAQQRIMEAKENKI